MLDNFNKFKKKIFLEALIKSLVVSISTGIVVFSVPYIFIKVKEIEFNLLYLILIALGVVLVLFTILFLIFKPNNKTAAIRIDNDLKLNEKVQTMVEYQNEDQYVVRLQKENTLNILGSIPLKQLSFKFGVMFFVLIALAFSMCVTVVALNVFEEDVEIIEPIDPDLDDDPDYDLDNWTIVAILEIIEKVEGSALDASLKVKYVNKLKELITLLESATKESEMVKLVVDVIDYVQYELDKVNTNNEIYTVLRETASNHVKDLAIQFEILNVEDIEKLLNNFVALINGTSDAIISLHDEFGILLQSSSLDRTDSLVSKIIEFSDEIYKCAVKPNVNEAVKEVVANLVPSIMVDVRIQATNKNVTDYVEQSLRNIFGINENNEVEDGYQGSEGNIDVEDPDPIDPVDPNASGGLGTGEVLFGSDDAIFDPEKGSVIYGEVITKYYGELVGKFDEGSIPSELKEFFEVYFSELFGDLNEEDEE